MKNYQSTLSEELKNGFLRDYILPIKVSELEEKMKEIEKRTGFIYKSIVSETHKAISPEEKYKKIQDLFPISSTDWEFKKWEGELNFFNSMKSKLLQDKRYRDKFVAIKGKEIIDSDIDDFRLVKRIDEGYPNDVVLVIKVAEKISVAEIPSPETPI